MNNNKLVRWANKNWQNKLRYCVNNNPPGVLAVLQEHAFNAAGLKIQAQQPTVNEIYDLGAKLAVGTGNPNLFVKELSYVVPHNDGNTGWANLKRP